MSRTVRNKSRRHVAVVLGMDDRFFRDGVVGGFAPATKVVLRSERGSRRAASRREARTLIKEALED